MDALKMEGVGLTYQTPQRETEALKNVNFTVKKGEFIAIVGPSGCGKTTILSLIAGLIRPNSGKVYINGNEINSVSEKIGYMLQKDQLFDWRTVKQNITLGLEIKKLNLAENLDYATSLLEKYGLLEFIHHYPYQLSGGMRQRVALIRTLAFKPEVLLLDEPFSALDFQTRLTVCDDVYKIIKNENKTTILVTHDISEAVSLADKIIVLTKRPATVKNVYEIKIDKPTPFLKREDPNFSKWFNTIWKEVV
jgi:NitT/TauT family transport system ATP-binding protein